MAEARLLFNSLDYVVFLMVVFAAYWALVRWAASLGVLLAASLLFYACWNPVYLVLIIASSLVDYNVGAAVGRSQDPRRRKLLMCLSIAYNLGVLAYFKYYNFFIDNVGDLFAWLDVSVSLDRAKVLLPVGISFFTFQSMSYTIDIYRRELEPIETDGSALDEVRGYGTYLLYVSFFPQLVAGPIVRAKSLLPQLLERPKLTDWMGGRGLFLIGLGLFKKVAIADYLALNLVDRVFATPEGFSGLEQLVGVYGYALQIYCDFSGYSDVAIGSALLLGYRFPDNFDAPYKARNLQDFWRRWHISLSTWLRDYLYISLGGNRKGAWKTYRNLALTMLLGGLWHGAGWNFIFWGALHGFALAILRGWQRARKRAGRQPLLRDWWGQALAVLFTFHYVCLAWIFFRAPDFATGWQVLKNIFTAGLGATNLDWRILAVMAVGFVMHFWPKRAFERFMAEFVRLPAPVQATALVLVGLGLAQVASSEAVPFIYFQF